MFKKRKKKNQPEVFKCRVVFDDGLEAIVECPAARGMMSVCYPFSFVTAKPGCIENVTVMLETDLTIPLKGNELPVYRPKPTPIDPEKAQEIKAVIDEGERQ